MINLGLDRLAALARNADRGDSFLSSVLHGVAEGGPLDPLEYVTSKRIKDREINRFRRTPITANSEWNALLKAIPVVKRIARTDLREPQ
jgi:hypothetical protein